jgi:hypothetical protein
MVVVSDKKNPISDFSDIVGISKCETVEKVDNFCEGLDEA